MVALKEQDYDKYARKMKKYLKWELIILDDFLLHTITDVFLATPSGITIDLFLKRFIIPLAHSFFLWIYKQKKTLKDITLSKSFLDNMKWPHICSNVDLPVY